MWNIYVNSVTVDLLKDLARLHPHLRFSRLYRLQGGLTRNGSRWTKRHNVVELMNQHLQEIRANARECKMLAATSLTEEAREILEEMAARYESQAATMALRPELNTPPSFLR